MRPVRLIIEGFSAFRDRVDINFDDADYFALVGPTGSGKSSVLDAICFALYGSVPRYNDPSAIAPALALGANQATVALDFTVGADAYVVVRVLARSPKSEAVKTKSAQLERRLAGDSTEVLASGQREVGSRVAELLGLQFEQFTKCVLLPQGDFARFLHDAPRDRQALLRDLLDLGVYRRIHQAAGQRGREAEIKAEAVDGRLADLPDTSPDVLAGAAARVVAADALEVDLETAHAAFAERAQAARVASAEVDRTTRALRAVDAVKVPIDALDGLSELGAAQLKLKTLEDAQAAAEAACERAEVAVAGAADLAVLTRARAAHHELGAAVAAADEAHSAIAPAQAAADAAVERGRAADAQHDQAVTALDALRTQHAPGELQRALVVGEACPVCEQVVHELPHSVRDLAALDTAKQAEQHAAKARREAERTATTASGVLDTARALHADRTRTIDRLRAAVEGHADLGALEGTIESVEQLHAVLDAARTDQRAVQRRRADARKAVDAAQQRTSEHVQAYQAQRDALVSAGLDPPAPTERLDSDWPTLAAFAADVRPDHDKTRAVAEEQRARLAADDAAELAAYATRAAALGIGTVSSIDALRRDCAAARQRAHSEQQALADAAARREVLQAEAAGHRAQAAVAAELHRLLAANRFESWLLEEAMDTLLIAGSENLLRLSGGAYSLDRNDRELMVIDHRNADEARPVRTLSGGETFQASLALALALAEHIVALGGDGAAKLESLFLDEGFGSLDPETLEVVTSTIETLADGDRMVGLVTHVRDLAERVPVRFEVRKLGRTSVVERVER